MKWIAIGVLSLTCYVANAQQAAINRKAVVQRHTIKINKADSLSSLSVGNGSFAFTVDVTGLQSFPAFYKGGVPLGTQSEWGWHSFPNTGNYKFEESLRTYELEGKKIPYPVQWKEPERNKNAADYFRVNPHRLQLGNIGFEIIKKNGQPAAVEDIKNIDQQLDMWTGEINSRFTVEGQPVQVITYAHQQQDLVAVKIVSPLVQQKKVKITLHFPYPNGQFKDVGVNEANADKHVTELHSSLSPLSALPVPRGEVITIRHLLDTTRYVVQSTWKQPASIIQQSQHRFVITPEGGSNTFEASFLFASKPSRVSLPSFAETGSNSKLYWERFWKSGGAVDFAGSKDTRAPELERRIILSQYLTKIQCSSIYPPQETGLTYNSWYGKPHLEMHWWHAVHFALWGRIELMEKSLDWYATVADGAKAIARRQGFEGLRWQKMTDHAGNESPSSVGSFLIWQQPHFIYMAELSYRERKAKQVLEKYKDLVFATADFMASFPAYDPAKKKYNLGKGLIPAQECFDAVTTFNPTYELAYWHWALNIAQQWRQRLGLPRKPEWDKIINNLAPLPQANGVYLATESTPDCYTTERYKTDHPAVLATYASIPGSNNLDTVVMRNTFDLVWKVWKWEDTWGWDFPLTAMTATRLHIPEKAIDALFLPVRTNTYLVNGHNYQDERLTIYLPGNGGLLSAIALMCAGSDADTTRNPGFPKDTWQVKWEGLRKMP
ncbi:hypothetical protein HB364_09265 [Pseudoflavitalea sp. X16]|uniref:hypothetical protein n=1 Tax=Paraflavitalea devenefica TaxID=2716334 RepID=UPI001423A3E3|nr:hypothetical protein [Paraflavitalea devenefica]NII25269.1 hypothetical protein [Paraflavitalea devenefica]